MIESPVLVTGGSGYLASRVLPQLSGVREIRVLSRRAPRAGVAVRWIEGHAGIPGTLDNAVRGARTIFHLAAQTSVAIAKQDPAADRAVNVTALERLLEAITAQGGEPPALVFAGTVTQSGIPDSDTLDERTPDRPITVYDTHKLEAEQLLEAAARARTVLGVTLRLANVYGPGARSGAADRGVLNKMIRLAFEGKALQIYGDGRQLRDYTFVDDVAAALVKAASHAADISGRHFVVGSGDRRTIAEIVNVVAERAAARTGTRVAIETVAAPPTSDPIDARSYIVDARAFRTATGWRPDVALDAGIDRTLAWIAQGAAE